MSEIVIMYTPDREDKAKIIEDILREFYTFIRLDPIDGRDTLFVFMEDYGYDEDSILGLIRDLIKRKKRVWGCV